VHILLMKYINTCCCCFKNYCIEIYLHLPLAMDV